jgi:diguanylate cyclase (GGDEF)-like protein
MDIIEPCASPRNPLRVEPTHEELVALHSLLRDVPGGAVERRLLACQSLDLPSGQHLIRRGETRAELYLVLRGRLGVVVAGAVLATIPAGQTVGELALLEPQAACADVVAEVDSRVLVLDAETFWEIVAESHQVALNMLRVLAARVRHSTFQLGTVEAQRRAMETLSRTDALTGLANRRWLDEALPRLAARSVMDGAPLSVIALDLDHFKAVNDTRGHATGDRVLRSFAEALRCVVRPTDFAARTGGEEIVLVLPATAVEGARVVAERIRRAACRTSVVDDDGRHIPPVTVSAGVAGLERAEDAVALLARADARLYDAKRRGRNRVEG